MSEFRVLVTGANGFVGQHLVAALKTRFGADLPLLATSAKSNIDGYTALDVTDAEAVSKAIADFRPTHVVNLAGIAAPKDAREAPHLAWQVHFNGILNLGSAVLLHAQQCALIAVGTSHCYGDSAKRGVPLDENATLTPSKRDDIYGRSKAAGDMLAGALADHGVHTIRLRPFNHTGPGQAENFIAPDFARQIALIEANKQDPVIRVGNLEPIRDYLDVRDVVAAYVAVVAMSSKVAPGTVLNVASGIPTPNKALLDGLLQLSRRKDIDVQVDESRVRQDEIPFFVGDASAARRLLGWAPKYSLHQTLQDVLDDWRARVKSGTAD